MTPFFKPILAFFAALLVGSLIMVAAHAEPGKFYARTAAPGVYQLPVPAGLSGYRHSCAATGFNADGTIRGTCVGVAAGACSGRGCQPTTYTTTYNTTWDANGAFLAVVACSLTRHHLPQITTVTPLGGIPPEQCPALDYSPNGTTVVVIDGVPYWYVSTDPVTGDELMNTNYAGFVRIM